MTTRRSCRFSVESLEARKLLSGVAANVAKGAVMPYAELTLKGHFTANAPTIVTFAAKHGATLTVAPASVTKSSIVVTVPAFFDPQTGQPIALTTSVSVHQTVGGHDKGVLVKKSLSIASLPQTGLLAGDLLGAVTNAAASVTNDATNTFLHPSQNLTNALGVQQRASGIIADLGEVSSLIPQAQQQLVALAFGAVSSVPLGTYQGMPATLDSSQLGLLDRIIAGGTNSAVGETPLVGTGQVALINGLVVGAIQDGPVEVIDRAMEVVDVLGTALGNPVIPPGAVVTGLAIGSLSAVVAAAEAEALIVQGAFSPSTTFGPSDLALVDRVLDDPALGQALNAITTGFIPTTPAGQALLKAAELAESLAAQIDPNVPGSAGAQFVTYLNSVPLHQG
jgi:hypothetical protein